MRPLRVIEAKEAIDRLRSAAGKAGRALAFMEVCGTHTVSAFRSGLHSLLPDNVRLISGPGCPVCVTSQGDINQMIELADRPNVTVCTYGDMMRVTGSRGSLDDARAAGADVRVVYSTLDAVKLAAAEPRRQVVFTGVGFETTTPATAAAVLAAEKLNLLNFTVLTSHKQILPAMRALLSSGDVRVDGFVCPGHVAVITGSNIFRPVVDEYHRPCVVTGFEGNQIAAALARLVEIVNTGQSVLENLYPQAVTPEGNRTAQRMIDEVFESVDVNWRGLGMLPASGLDLRQKFARYSARVRFQLGPSGNEEPPGCRCGDVITGRCLPEDCKLFASACTPVRPVGPCMVSSEGTCQAFFKFRRRGGKGLFKQTLKSPVGSMALVQG